MKVALETYTTRLPRSIKQSIKVLAAQNDCSQQELIIRLVEKECKRKEGKDEVLGEII